MMFENFPNNSGLEKIGLGRSVVFSKNSFIPKLALIFFGLFLAVLLLEAGLRIAGFTYNFLQERANRLSLRQRGEYIVLCVGESTTALGGKNAYPRQLEKILNEADTGVKFNVLNKGLAATNTYGILSRLEKQLDTYKPDMVVAMMGFNDGPKTPEYPGSGWLGAVCFLRGFRTYKLARLLAKRVRYKIKEIGENLQDFEEPSELIPEVELDQKELLNWGDIYRRKGSYKMAEKMYEKAIGLDPQNSYAYTCLGDLYLRIGRNSKAEQMFKKAIKVQPEEFRGYYGVGFFYAQQERYESAAEMYKKVIKCIPASSVGYEKLGVLYITQGRYDEAEKMLKQAIKRKPENVSIYENLAEVERIQGGYDEAEGWLKKAIEVDPQSQRAYEQLGKLFWEQGEWEQAEEMFAQAIKFSPEKPGPCDLLGDVYFVEKKFKKAEAMYIKEIKAYPANHPAYLKLVRLYKKLGFSEQAEDVYNQMVQPFPATRRNYRHLRELVARRGIKLVCVQYPVRPLKSLMDIFDSKWGIIFVDNQKVFKTALAGGRYEEYFGDKDGGDFGHCTPKGNRLLAENIARVIRKEYLADLDAR